MGWGWYLLIAIVILLAIPLFVPLIVRVRAASETREFDYEVALGPLPLLPDLGDNLQRYKRAVGKPLYIITRPLVWLFKGIALLFRALTWPIRALRRARRKKQIARREAASKRDGAAQVDKRRTLFEFDEGDEAPPSEVAPAHFEPPAPEKPSESIDEPSPTPETGDEPMDREDLDEFEKSEAPFGEPEKRQRRGEEGKRPRNRFMDIPWRGAWNKARGGYQQAREMIRRYGRTGKRTVRAFLLFGKECFQALSFRVFQLQWSTGGDPAALGQLLGWHYTLTGALDPRMQQHVRFDPDWDSEELAPRGQAQVVLYIWPYRFIPPAVRLLFRMPWWGLIRVAREQILKRS